MPPLFHSPEFLHSLAFIGWNRFKRLSIVWDHKSPYVVGKFHWNARKQAGKTRTWSLEKKRWLVRFSGGRCRTQAGWPRPEKETALRVQKNQRGHRQHAPQTFAHMWYFRDCSWYTQRLEHALCVLGLLLEKQKKDWPHSLPYTTLVHSEAHGSWQ